MPTPPLAGLREATDADAPGLAELIGGVFDEYPGCVLDPDGVDRDLGAIRSWLARAGGRLWVVEDEEGDGAGVAACGGYVPTTVAGLAAVEVKRLYVARARRRRGIGGALLELVGQVAGALGAPVVDLWSDTRFEAAHRRYSQAGFVRQPETRELHDPSDTTEYRYLRLAAPKTPPTATRLWRGDDGRLDRCALREGPRTGVLAGNVLTVDPCGGWRYAVTVDEAWRPRHVEVRSLDGDGATVLTGDGLGRWWQDGAPRQDLRGCLDVDLECTPATNTIPIRRAVDGEIDVAWVRVPALDVVRVTQRYTAGGTGRWRYRSGDFAADLTVDEHGLVGRYGADGLWVACGSDG